MMYMDLIYTRELLVEGLKTLSKHWWMTNRVDAPLTFFLFSVDMLCNTPLFLIVYIISLFSLFYIHIAQNTLQSQKPCKRAYQKTANASTPKTKTKKNAQKQPKALRYKIIYIENLLNF